MTRLFAPLALLGALLGCGNDSAGARDISKNQAPGVMHCMGRVVFSLPASWTPGPSVTAAFRASGAADDAEDTEVLTRENWTRELFSKSVTERLEEIRSVADATTDVLEANEVVGPDEVLIRIRVIGSTYSSELHKMIGKTYVRLSSQSYEGKYAAAEDRLRNISRELHVVGPKTLAGGFCLGSVVLTGQYIKEWVLADFYNTDHEGALLSFNVDTYRQDERATLFDRAGGKDSLLTRFGMSPEVIRKRKIVMAGMQAQEWLAWMPGGDGDKNSRFLQFTAETHRNLPAGARPSVHISFTSARRTSEGVKAQNSYTEGDALRLWDGLINSVTSAVSTGGAINESAGKR